MNLNWILHYLVFFFWRPFFWSPHRDISLRSKSDLSLYYYFRYLFIQKLKYGLSEHYFVCNWWITTFAAGAFACTERKKQVPATLFCLTEYIMGSSLSLLYMLSSLLARIYMNICCSGLIHHARSIDRSCMFVWGVGIQNTLDHMCMVISHLQVLFFSLIHEQKPFVSLPLVLDR